MLNFKILPPSLCSKVFDKNGNPRLIKIKAFTLPIIKIHKYAGAAKPRQMRVKSPHLTVLACALERTPT